MQRPDARWGTDLMYLRLGSDQYFLDAFLDEYSRYLAQWELLTTMDGERVNLAAQRAVETLPHDKAWKPLAAPVSPHYSSSPSMTWFACSR